MIRTSEKLPDQILLPYLRSACQPERDWKWQNHDYHEGEGKDEVTNTNRDLTRERKEGINRTQQNNTRFLRQESQAHANARRMQPYRIFCQRITRQHIQSERGTKNQWSI